MKTNRYIFNSQGTVNIGKNGEIPLIPTFIWDTGEVGWWFAQNKKIFSKSKNVTITTRLQIESNSMKSLPSKCLNSPLLLHHTNLEFKRTMFIYQRTIIMRPFRLPFQELNSFYGLTGLASIVYRLSDILNPRLNCFTICQSRQNV